ncbi:MAG: hypothetical protein KDK78_00445 [Chlamydiia bacterium]|nr:hypothetical protein [Chlamydiia bacterium]
MKKYLLALACAFASVSSAFASHTAISLTDMSDEMFAEFLSGTCSDVILECKEGTVLPIQFDFKGDFIAIQQGDAPASVVVLKSCYVKCAEGDFFFSTDLDEWKDFEAFFTGRLGFSMKVENSLPSLACDLDLYRRSE